MTKEICINCGREKIALNEGRYIDGSWIHDKDLKEYNSQWVCCFNCYQKLLWEKEVIQKNYL